MTKKRLPVLVANPYNVDKPDDDESVIPADKVAYKYAIEHRPPPPKGFFYEDDVDATKKCKVSRPGLCAVYDKEEKAKQDAVKFLAKLADDPGLKARKLRSLAKSAGVEFEPYIRSRIGLD